MTARITERVVRFDDFSGGEYGDLGAAGATHNMFTGTNVMRYQDGSVGPRPGTKAINLTGASTGLVWALRGLSATLGAAVVYGQGSNVYGFTATTTSTVVAVGTVSTTVTTASQIVQYGPGVGELARYGDKVYTVDTTTPVVTPLAGSPGAKVLTAYGVRLMAANATVTTTVVASKRVYYSDASNRASWPALNFFDVGDPSWPVSAMDEIRQRLILPNEGGEWWALSGTPGVNDVLRRLPRADLSPLQWYHAARSGETIWFFPHGEDFPAQFTGVVVNKLQFRHLRFTAGVGTDWAVTAHPMSESVLAVEDGGSKRGLLYANGCWTYHTFGITTSRFLSPTSVGGAGANQDAPLILCDGGGASAAPTFSTLALALDRPAKVSDTWAQPGDNSTTPLTASLSTPAIFARDGYECWARKVRIDGYTWNPGNTSVTNHFDIVARSWFRYNVAGTKDSTTQSFDETAATTTADKTPRQWVRRFGDEQRGDAFQIVLSNLRGVAVRSIEIEIGETPRT